MLRLVQSLCCFGLLLFTACEPETFLPNDSVLVDDRETSTEVAPTESYANLLDLVNQLRASGCRCGGQVMPPVGAVSWSGRLAEASKAHSQDMQDNDFFNHTGSDGSNPGTRITRTGYRWRTYGENIAVGYSSAAAVFQGWKDSPGHCKNMMNEDFTEMGAARVGTFWTQDFATAF